MATVEHRLLTTGELHEPKGIGAAPAGYQYRSNGSGSGAWEKIHGFVQHEDSRTTVGTPALNIATGVRTKYVNNSGSRTVSNHLDCGIPQPTSTHLLPSTTCMTSVSALRHRTMRAPTHTSPVSLTLVVVLVSSMSN